MLKYVSVSQFTSTSQEQRGADLNHFVSSSLFFAGLFMKVKLLKRAQAAVQTRWREIAALSKARPLVCVKEGLYGYEGQTNFVL